MARGDKTGPMGQGPMTGRKLGYCSGNESSGFSNGVGRGMGSGRGFSNKISRGGGQGFRRMFGFGTAFTNNPANNRDYEINILKSQAESLKQTQQEIEKRLRDLES